MRKVFEKCFVYNYNNVNVLLVRTVAGSIPGWDTAGTNIICRFQNYTIGRFCLTRKKKMKKGLLTPLTNDGNNKYNILLGGGILSL